MQSKSVPDSSLGYVRKVALVAPYDYSRPGGVTVHISSLAHIYHEMGLDVRVIAACSDGENVPEQVFNASSSTVPIHYSGSVSHISLSGRAYGRIRDIMREENFDVVHVHEPICPAIPLYALLLSHSLNVGTFHAYRDSNLSLYQLCGPLRTVMERLDGRIAVSAAARDYIARFFPGEYVVVPNGIEYEFFAADVPPIERFADGRPNILFVGRLHKRKGFQYLIEAYESVKRACPEVRLLVTGNFNDEDMKPFIEFTEERRLPDVHFIGYVNREELRRYYRTCDIFCAPSTGFESFGYVLVEAMAAGKPVVASDIDGYRAVLQHGVQGLLVPPENSGALAQALIKLIRNPEERQRMAANGRVRAVEFSWNRVAKTLLDYYNSLIEKKRMKEPLCSRII